jgi:hypothetical protein
VDPGGGPPGSEGVTPGVGPRPDPEITVFGVVLERFWTAYKGVQALLGFGGVPKQSQKGLPEVVFKGVQ